MSLTNDLKCVTKAVTKNWTAQRKREERNSRARHHRSEYLHSDRVNFTDVAHKILPDAYQHASGGGQYTVSKRQLYYACREQFREKTDRELEYSYFAGTLLVQYMNRHSKTTAGWKVTADPRGTLTIPNTGHDERIPVGTIQIENHLRKEEQRHTAFDGLDKTFKTEWPSLAAGQRYQAVLYIEKEGFEPILQEARIGERYDLAIISCKGQSVVAARRYVDHVCDYFKGVPLFVVHDFDKSGFEIAQRLTQVSDWARQADRVTYQFENEINVADLGLRLEDIERYGLVDEACDFKGRFARDSICTPQEKDFLQSGRRVELNAFTSPQFIEWLESKLTFHLPKRLIPDDDVLLEAYRHALAVAEINRVIEQASDSAMEKATDAKVPKTLRRQLKQAMKETEEPWDTALYRLAKSKGCDDMEADA